MKQISVSFTQPVPYTYWKQRWNKEAQRWEDKQITDMVDHVTFWDLTSAKKFIKTNIQYYKTSCILKSYANGDWVNLGEVKISGSNRHLVANSAQHTESYA